MFVEYVCIGSLLQSHYSRDSVLAVLRPIIKIHHFEYLITQLIVAQQLNWLFGKNPNIQLNVLQLTDDKISPGYRY